MISVVIPTLNAADTLVPTLSALVEAAMRGLVQEVIIADGGSTDDTLAIADDAGAVIVRCEKGRGNQLARGARAARAPFLLFLHADTILAKGWEHEALRFMRKDGERKAAYFRFALDETRKRGRFLEKLVALRCRLFALPYGDQGLLISKALYERLGGFKPLPLMEDVDLVGRLKRKRLVGLNAAASTSARRYRTGGYVARPLRNLFILTLWKLGVPAKRLARLYG